MTRETWSVIWDVHHIAEHGLTVDEVEEVLLDRSSALDWSDSSGRPLRQGWTSLDGSSRLFGTRLNDDTVRPVTAYEVG